MEYLGGVGLWFLSFRGGRLSFGFPLFTTCGGCTFRGPACRGCAFLVTTLVVTRVRGKVNIGDNGVISSLSASRFFLFAFLFLSFTIAILATGLLFRGGLKRNIFNQSATEMLAYSNYYQH